MANLTAAYARMRAEENQPDPEDFDTYEEYEAEASAYWERTTWLTLPATLRSSREGQT